jgi:hypothetical protein
VTGRAAGLNPLIVSATATGVDTACVWERGRKYVSVCVCVWTMISNLKVDRVRRRK